MRRFDLLSFHLRSWTVRGLAVLSGAALFASSAPSASLLLDPAPRLVVDADAPLEFSTPALPAETDASSGGGVPGAVNINWLLGAERFYDAGYTGTRAVLANIEAGVVWDGHQDFGTTGHINYMDPVGGALATLANIDFHATAVAGMMAARGGLSYPTDPHRWGISHGAQFWTGGVATSYPASAGYSGSFSTDETAVASTYEQAVLDGMGGSAVIADVINGSWGTIGGGSSAGFTTFAVIMDALAWESRALLVFSAGNSGPIGNTLGSPGAAYNTLAVGALQTPDFDQLWNFSSRSPTDFVSWETGSAQVINGVRAAVDIVAPGTAMLTPVYGGQSGGNQSGGDLFGWTPASDDLYFNLDGTSFAAPLVAGGAALLVDAGRDLYASDPDAIDALVLKAVLLNSADKLPGWTNGQSEVAEVGGRYGTDTVLSTTQSLDYGFGAGRMNLDRAFDQYVLTTNGGMAVTTNVGANISGDLGSVGAVGWDFGSVQSGGQNTYFISDMLSGGSQFSTTLAWYADRAYDQSVNGYYDNWFSDLELYVFAYDPVDMSILGPVAESISTYNLVEHLWFDLPETGYYGIRVDYFGDLWNFFGHAEPVEYGLAWSGVLFVPEPGRAMLLMGSVFFLILRRRRS